MDIERRAVLTSLGLGGLAASWAGWTAVGADSTTAVAFTRAPAYEQVRETAELRRLQPLATFDVPTTTGLVALTFDDGPDPSYTPQVLNLLEQFNALATFFLVGKNAALFPDIARDIVARGHSIGNHTLDHVDLVQLTAPQILAQIDGGEREIRDVTGQRPVYFRPPLGSTNQAVGVLADARQYTTVFWTLSLEAMLAKGSVEDAATRTVQSAQPGSVLLAHDGGHHMSRTGTNVDRQPTIAALPLLLAGLAARGLGVVDIPTLLEHAQRPFPVHDGDSP